MKRPCIALTLALAAASPAAAGDETIGLRWREWFAKLNGHIQGQGEFVPASDINLTETLGLDGQENGHELQVYLSLPFVGRLYGGYWWLDFEGSETLERDITFADVTFTATTTVDTELHLDMYYLTYEFVLPSIPLASDAVGLEIGVQIGARALVVDASIDSALLAADDDGAVGVPVVGIRGALQVTEFLRAELEFAGMALSYGTSSLRYVEGFGEIVGQLGPFFGGVGYKWCSLDLTDDSGDADFMLEVKIDGFYVTAGLRF